MEGSRYTQGFQGGRPRANYNVAPSPSPHGPPGRSGPPLCDTPLEDRGVDPSRTRILEGVRPRSSIGVSKSEGPWRPRAYSGAPGALIIPSPNGPGALIIPSPNGSGALIIPSPNGPGAFIIPAPPNAVGLHYWLAAAATSLSRLCRPFDIWLGYPF